MSWSSGKTREVLKRHLSSIARGPHGRAWAHEGRCDRSRPLSVPEPRGPGDSPAEEADMIRALRRLFVVAAPHGFKWMAAILLLAWGTTFLGPRPAVADETCDKWKRVALSDVGLGQRLGAIEELRKAGSSPALTALEDVARTGDLPVATAACAALGRAKSSPSKGVLKELLEDGNLATNVRIAAASCIAVHWEDSGDKSYLESESEGNAALAAHVEILKSKVYGE